MKRSEQDIRFQWDLTKIYPDTAAWETAMQEAEAALAPLKDLPGTLGTSKEAFQHGLDTVYASMLKVELPYIYAFLKKTEDGSVAENQEMAARSESLLVKFSAATAFLNPEILAIPAEKLDAWMQDEVLATYRHTVDDIVRMRAHTLDAAREQMLALLGDAAGTPKAAFEMLTDVDLQLPMVKNDAGEEVRLTPGTFPVYRESRSRAVREGAFRAMFGTYRQFGDAIAALYGGSSACPYGCLGYGDCVKACKFDAIHVVDGVARVDYDKCKGCGMCAQKCPKKIILFPLKDDPYPPKPVVKPAAPAAKPAAAAAPTAAPAAKPEAKAEEAKPETKAE